MDAEPNQAGVQGSRGEGLFLTTRWSRVIRARDLEGNDSAKALEDLCRAYWKPLYHFSRRKGNSPEDAQDLTQGFIAQLLASNSFGKAMPEKGRFRTFLMSAFGNYMANAHRDACAQKRGGGAHIRSLDDPGIEAQYVGADQMTPERLYERTWALSLLERVLLRLRGEYEEAGEHETQPYFSMRLVRGGKNIAHWAAEHRGSYAGIAAAVASVARAVAHAHERGVLHRDLKPSNILWDVEAGPQVTDFGLAKLLDSPDGVAGHSLMLMGSPNYMAPEQAGGRQDGVTTATDVYGIGAVLYELLAGKPPFLGKSVMDIARKVADDAPPPLTDVPRDLRTVCMKCLEKQPEDRYASAAALAEDLERFTRGEPVQAVPHTRAELLWRWAKRKPALATLTALIPLLSIIGFSAVTWQWRRAETARVEQAVALEHLHWEQTDQWVADGDSPRALAYLASLLRAQPQRWQAAMYAMSVVDQTTFPLLAGPKVEMPSKLALPSQLAPDGTWFASAGKDKVVRLWDVATGSERRHFSHAWPVTALAVCSGPWKLAVATEDGVLAVRADLSADSQTLPRAQKESILDLRFSADGSRLLVRGKESVEVWATGSSTAAPLVLPLSGGIKGASLSADGSRVLVWNQHLCSVWEVSSQKELLAVTKRVSIANAALAASGKVVAILDGQYQVLLWDLDSGEALPGLQSELFVWFHLALDAPGAHIALGGFNNEITVHDTTSGVKVSPEMLHSYLLDSITVSPDGRRLFSIGWDEMLYSWDASTGRSLRAPVRPPWP